MRIPPLFCLGLALSGCASTPAAPTHWTSPDRVFSLSIPEAWEHVAPNRESTASGYLLLTAGTTNGALYDVSRTEVGIARNYVAAFMRWAKQRQEESGGVHSYDFQSVNRQINGVPVLDYTYTSTDLGLRNTYDNIRLVRAFAVDAGDTA